VKIVIKELSNYGLTDSVILCISKHILCVTIAIVKSWSSFLIDFRKYIMNNKVSFIIPGTYEVHA